MTTLEIRSGQRAFQSSSHETDMKTDIKLMSVAKWSHKACCSSASPKGSTSTLDFVALEWTHDILALCYFFLLTVHPSPTNCCVKLLLKYDSGILKDEPPDFLCN